MQRYCFLLKWTRKNDKNSSLPKDLTLVQSCPIISRERDWLRPKEIVLRMAEVSAMLRTITFQGCRRCRKKDVPTVCSCLTIRDWHNCTASAHHISGLHLYRCPFPIGLKAHWCVCESKGITSWVACLPNVWLQKRVLPPEAVIRRVDDIFVLSGE